MLRRTTAKAAVSAVEVPDDVISVLTALRDYLQVTTPPCLNVVIMESSFICLFEKVCFLPVKSLF